VCYTTVYRGINSLTLTYTTRDSCITYKYSFIEKLTNRNLKIGLQKY